ncbi:MAG: hypothetical protein JWQ71_2209, partial [Pedosphaera sp.]|nr:hypothetical protein [Pedosphaera sp.]
MELDDQHPGPKNDQAEKVVRQLGRDAVPTIIKLLEARDTSLKQRLAKWAS